jgi:hypothetical protein
VTRTDGGDPHLSGGDPHPTAAAPACPAVDPHPTVMTTLPTFWPVST